MAITISNAFITKLQMASDGSFNIIEDFAGTAGFISASAVGGSGGGSGVGEWYFYSDEGNINAGPPVSDGNIIFTVQGNPVLETFNPNSSGGATYINIAVTDAAGTSYLTQFNNLASNGGTLSITQNGDTATYSTNAPGGFFVESGIGTPFLVISTSIQTASSSAPFVFGDPISITIS